MLEPEGSCREESTGTSELFISFSCFTVFLSAIPSLKDLWGARGGSAGVSGWKQGVYLEMYVLLAAVTMRESFLLGDLCGWLLFFKIAESKAPFSGNDKGTTKRVMGESMTIVPLAVAEKNYSQFKSTSVYSGGREGK